MNIQVDVLIRLLTLLNSSQSLEKAAHSMVGQANLIFGSDASAFYLPVDGLSHCLAAAGLHADHLEQSKLPSELNALMHLTRVIDILQEQDIDLESPDMTAYLTCFSQTGRVVLVPLHLGEGVNAALVLGYSNRGKVVASKLEDLDVFRRFSEIGLGNIIQHQQRIQKERDRIARDLHDAVTQAVYSMTILAEGRRRLAASGRLENNVESFSELGELAQQALRELRLIVHGLRNPLLEECGLVEALKQRLNKVEQRAGVKADLIVEGEIRLPPEVEVELYWIAEEALNNMLKHSFAASIVCKICQESGQVVLEIKDGGRGFELKDGQSNGGMGLTNMAERAEKIGASFSVETRPGAGTIVQVSAPTREMVNGQ
jgi:signal transduction histidine kinase